MGKGRNETSNGVSIRISLEKEEAAYESPLAHKSLSKCLTYCPLAGVRDDNSDHACGLFNCMICH